MFLRMINLNVKLPSFNTLRVTQCVCEHEGYSLKLINCMHQSVFTESSEGTKFAEIIVFKNNTIVRTYKVVVWYHKGSDDHYVTVSALQYTEHKCNISKKSLVSFVQKNLIF